MPDTLTRVTGNGGVSVSGTPTAQDFTTHGTLMKASARPADMNFYEQLYFHKLGTPQSQDTYVMGKDLPRIAEISLTENKDGTYFLAEVGNGDGGQYEHFLRDPAGHGSK